MCWRRNLPRQTVRSLRGRSQVRRRRLCWRQCRCRWRRLLWRRRLSRRRVLQAIRPPRRLRVCLAALPLLLATAVAVAIGRHLLAHGLAHRSRIVLAHHRGAFAVQLRQRARGASAAQLPHLGAQRARLVLQVFQVHGEAQQQVFHERRAIPVRQIRQGARAPPERRRRHYMGGASSGRRRCVRTSRWSDMNVSVGYQKQVERSERNAAFELFCVVRSPMTVARRRQPLFPFLLRNQPSSSQPPTEKSNR